MTRREGGPTEETLPNPLPYSDEKTEVQEMENSPMIDLTNAANCPVDVVESMSQSACARGKHAHARTHVHPPG